MILRIVGLLFACIIAPTIAAALGAAAYGVATDCAGYGCTGIFFTGGVMMGAMLGALVGGPIALLVGAPLHFCLKRRGVTGFAAYALAGALVGLPAAVLVGVSVQNGRMPDMMWTSWTLMLACGAATGVLAAWMFWGMMRLQNSSVIPADRRESRDPAR